MYFVTMASEHKNCPTENDYRRAIMSSKSQMQEGGKWRFSRIYREDGIQDKCKKKVGEVSTTFEGYGKARLRYKICDQGNVNVYLDEQELDSETSDPSTGIFTIDFEFTPASKLKIEEDDIAMVDLISLDLGCRGMSKKLHQ